MRVFTKLGQTYYEAAGLKGPVRQLMLTTYKAHVRSGAIERGQILLESHYMEENIIVTLNENGHQKHVMTYGDYMDAEYSFDEQGRQIITSDYRKGKLLHTTTLTYDGNGKHTGSQSINADGTQRYLAEVRYNEKGQQVESLHYHGDGSAGAKRTVWEYNETGQMTGLTTTAADGTIEHECQKTYDDHGNNIESISRSNHKHSNPTYERTVYRYNEHNDCIQFTGFDEQGNETRNYNYTYQYDAEGKKIIEKRDDDDKVEGQTETEITDQHGNWTTKTVFHKGIPVTIHVRDIVYFGEPERALVHPLTLAKESDIQVVRLKETADVLTEDQARWLAEHPGLPTDQFPNVRYYALRYKQMPTLVSYSKGNIEALALHKTMKERFHAIEVHAAFNKWGDYQPTMTRYSLTYPSQPGYLLHAVGLSAHDSEEYQVPDHLKIGFGERIFLSSFQLFRPSDASGDRDTRFEDELNYYLESHMLDRRPERPKINMIEVRGSSYAVVEHAVDDSFTIRDLDVNYGHGFHQFHTDLMQRFSSGTKGLVLFHGHPGTGKTYYIRHLLRQMAASKKRVIYMPPNMVDHLTDPSFMTFLLSTVKSWSHDGQFCVLLIEDAEPLLAKRQEGVRIQGVTNLLNMTDGLLNDMLNLQIVCTFNVDLRKLDSALLRPGRLIARKEFKALSELDANLLAQRLGIKHHFKGPATLGEIYAKLKNSNTLIHDVDPNKDASSHIDDLM